MNYHDRIMITVICESLLEEKITLLAKKCGVDGYTAISAKGEGSRGLRGGDFEYNKNIKIEFLCKSETADILSAEIQKTYFKDYAVVLYRSTVSVLRGDKFK